MTTADVSLVAKESIVVEKLKNYMPAQFFCPIPILNYVRVRVQSSEEVLEAY